jgi:hypothetical protein
MMSNKNKHKLALFIVINVIFLLSIAIYYQESPNFITLKNLSFVLLAHYVFGCVIWLLDTTRRQTI